MYSFTQHNVHFPSFSKKSTPAFYRLLALGVALVLAVSGIAKLADASAFLQTLHQLSFLNESLVIWTATLLPIIELGLAAALFLQWNPPVTLGITTLLFAGFLGFAIYGLTTGMSGDCGCFGSLAESGFGWGMIVRNSCLLIASSWLWFWRKDLFV